ncbi:MULTISPECIES: fumarylacetoacetate hydrolase family protein [unclassified Streptomyces]|uniref:2-keto-4-pentenoate hydratase n=1 Tax=unclassified Streptomyces TaxID=2593676 RepID=UPI00081D7541|nr:MULTISPECIES: fumarylacetoacetate hydrolase family protein [unclassified Streptomyces]MYZ34449.1 2-keto-4-pentenoate hydratase [Streptomyces sp. SID4917]SCF67436.1 2-keto-4-pentenoate hydratase [Streptomyces sp. MnatMP-M17]
MSPEQALGAKRSPVSDSVIAEAADRLATAASTGVTCAPVRDLIGPDDIAAAYRIQQMFNRLRAHDTATVGRKIGATSKAVQAQLGVDQPDFGVLYADMQYSDGDVIPMDRLLQPRVEAEVAFVLEADLTDGPLDVAQCRAAVAYAVPALEIVDSRITDWDISFADTVADNASSGLYVLGTQRRTLEEFEPVDVIMGLKVDDGLVSSGDGAACLGDPLNALAWLAKRAREFGDPLTAGQVILSGSLGPLAMVRPGSAVKATIKSLGTVSATFTDGITGPQQEVSQ